jgi:TIR domain
VKVFISHDSDDAFRLKDLVDRLRDEGVESWDSREIRRSGGIEGRLLRAIKESDLCIFIATQDSVASAWCMNELGAFWALDRPILVFKVENRADVSGMAKGISECKSHEEVMTEVRKLSAERAPENVALTIREDPRVPPDDVEVKRPRLVLWADPNSNLTSFYWGQLEEEGIEVVVVTSADELVAELAARRVGAVVSTFRSTAIDEALVVANDRYQDTAFFVYALNIAQERRRRLEARGFGVHDRGYALVSAVRAVLSTAG